MVTRKGEAGTPTRTAPRPDSEPRPGAAHQRADTAAGDVGGWTWLSWFLLSSRAHQQSRPIGDTWITKILEELAPRPDDIVTPKHRYGGFFEPDLEAVLRERGITERILTGCTTSVCVESTLRDALYRGRPDAGDRWRAAVS